MARMSKHQTMQHSTNLTRALNFTKYSVFLLRCWPPARTASRVKKTLFELSWWAMFISSLCLLFPLLSSVYVYRDNLEVLTKSVCLTCAVSQCTIKTLFCRMRHNKLQKIIEEMENFMNDLSYIDRKILEKYVTKCTVLHIYIAVWTYLTSISFIIGPLFTSQSFPTDAVYPFSIDNIYIRILIYAHQSLVGLQTSAAVLLDCLVAVFIWFITARFEILALLIDSCDDFEKLKYFIQQYQSLVRYTNNTKNTVDLFIFSTILTSVGGVLFSTIQLISDQSLTVKAQYAVVAVTASVGLFACSWAAENLIEKNFIVGVKIFHSNWYEIEKKAKKSMLHLIVQFQKPMTIKVSHMLPTLSLTFFSQFLSTTFKIFTTLRIVIS